MSNQNRNRMRQSTTWCDNLPDTLNYWVRRVTDGILWKVICAHIDEVSKCIPDDVNTWILPHENFTNLPKLHGMMFVIVCCQNRSIHVQILSRRHFGEPIEHTPDHNRNTVGLLRTNVITTYGARVSNSDSGNRQTRIKRLLNKLRPTFERRNSLELY